MVKAARSHRKRTINGLAIVLAAVISTLLVMLFAVSSRKHQTPEPKKPNIGTYTINLLSGTSYPVNTPKDLVFDIRDSNNSVLNQFADDQEQIMQVLVLRKDRSNYQHLHPEYDKNNGKFVFSRLNFAQDGAYRLFVLFDENGDKDTDKDKAFTLYKDITVGSQAAQASQPFEEKLTSSLDGYDTSFFYDPSGDSPTSSPDKRLFANQNSTIAISIDKDQKPFTQLKDYKGSLARIVAFGPNLELIAANSEPVGDVNNQSGLVIFNLNFPVSGTYKLFMQTESADKVSTFDYAINVLANPVQKAR